MNGVSESPWLDWSGAARYCACSREKIRLAVCAGTLKKHTGGAPGKLVRFHRDDLDRWLRGKKGQQ